MIWILPALSALSLLAYWAGNAKLRRNCDAKFAQGTTLLAAANYRQAVASFEAAHAIAVRITIQAGDRAIICSLNAATALHRAGQIEAAYQAATTAFNAADRKALGSYSVQLYILMADLSEENNLAHRSVGFRQVAVALLRRAGAEQTSQMAEQLAKLGRSLTQSGLLEHAIKSLTEATEIASGLFAADQAYRNTYSEYLLQLGGVCARLGDRHRAEAALKQALDLQKSATLENPRRRKRDLENASITNIGIASTESNPRLVPILTGLGRLYSDWGRETEAIRCFEEAYRIQVKVSGPSDAQVGVILSRYADCLRKAGRLDGAEDAAARAVKLLEMNGHPGLATGLGTLASVLMAGGNYRRAVDIFEQADTASVAAPNTGSPLDTADRLESHAEALERLQTAVNEPALSERGDVSRINFGSQHEVENLRSVASSIRATLASVPPAEQLFDSKPEDFLQGPEWPHRSE